MDTIILRLPLIKTRHWKVTKAKLARILIITEIIGILAMVWYLRVPLYQKFLAVKPKAYSLQAFSPGTRYLLSENDFLFGTSSPGYKVKLIFTAGRQKRTVQVSEKGNWVAQLPSDLEHKSYRLSAAHFDTNNKLSQVESFKIYVQSEAILYQSYPYRYYIRPLLPQAVQAKEPVKPKASALPSPAPESKPAIAHLSTPSSWSKEFTGWVNQAQAKGLYPYCEFNGQLDPSCNEAGDIVLTDYATYANVCQEAVSCYISSQAITGISPQIDPILIRSLERGEPIAYAAVATILEPELPLAPSYRNLTLNLADTTVDPLNDEERALLDQRDGKTPPFDPYVEVVNSLPSVN